MAPKKVADGKGVTKGKGTTGGSGYKNGNDRGFLKPKAHQPRDPRVRWTAENDRKLLMYANGREIAASEYKTIAARFPENPTPKAIQERISKLRIETEQMLNEDNLSGIQAELNLLSEDELSEGDAPKSDTAYSPLATRSSRTIDATGTSPTTARSTRKQSQPSTAEPASPDFSGLTTHEDMAGVANLMVLGALDRQRTGRSRAVAEDEESED